MVKNDAMRELKKILINHLREDIDRVILFGSRASSSAPESSDYDVLVILKNPYDWRKKNRVYDATYEVDLKYDILTDIKLIARGELETLKGKQPYIRQALENGIDL